MPSYARRSLSETGRPASGLMRKALITMTESRNTMHYRRSATGNCVANPRALMARARTMVRDDANERMVAALSDRVAIG